MSTEISHQKMRTLLLEMVQALVNTPDSVTVEQRVEPEAVTYLVQVAPADIGYVIGKDGRVANAVRVVLKEAAKRNGMKVYLDVKGCPAQTAPN